MRSRRRFNVISNVFTFDDASLLMTLVKTLDLDEDPGEDQEEDEASSATSSKVKHHQK